jgi:pimeloyl-[acyl-carrier protein] methyl ester esterase
MAALVLLPGMDGTVALRRDFVTALGLRAECIVVDYPPGCTDGYAELEAMVRSKLPSDRPYVLLGESFSGPIAISIAATRPPGLIGLVLCCSFTRNPRPILGLFRRLLPLLPFKFVPTSLLSSFVMGRDATALLRSALHRALSEIPSAILRARVAAVMDADMSPLLPNVHVPVLYLRGAHDRVVPRSCSDQIAQSVRQAKIVEIDAPHFLLQTAPTQAADAVVEFVKGIPPVSAAKS